ncbi:flippase-like domain-containing protein [Candidatus Saccharibacteria bacterium]|nr:flippase-like domain-containing protein [Candidatus Saccharibacteria bacterium]
MSEQKKAKWRIYLTIFTFAALIALVYKLRAQIVDVLNNLRHIHSAILLLIIPFEVINYHAYAELYKSLFATFGRKVKYWPMYRLAVELNFVNQILPSGGVSGISYFGLRAKTFDISTPIATLAQFIKMMFLYLSFLPLLILGLFFLAIKGHVNNLVIMVATLIITLVIVGTLLVIYIIGSRSRINTFLTLLTKIVNGVIHAVRPHHPETINIIRAQAAFDELHDNYQIFKKDLTNLKKPFLYTMLANATEIGALYSVYLAFGHPVNLGAVILAYAVANFAGLVSVLPAGIGIYEGLMTAVLVATGIPAQLSIPVTLTYRVIALFIQLTPGFILYQKTLHGSLATKK